MEGDSARPDPREVLERDVGQALYNLMEQTRAAVHVQQQRVYEPDHVTEEDDESDPEDEGDGFDLSTMAHRALDSMGLHSHRCPVVKHKPLGRRLGDMAECLLQDEKINEGEYKELIEAAGEVHNAVSARHLESVIDSHEALREIATSLISTAAGEKRARLLWQRRAEDCSSRVDTAVMCLVDMARLIEDLSAQHKEVEDSARGGRRVTRKRSRAPAQQRSKHDILVAEGRQRLALLMQKIPEICAMGNMEGAPHMKALVDSIVRNE